MPEPGYTYKLNGFKWPTIPDVLQEAGISWRIYQDPNNNWTGAMHGCLAFDSFRNAKPGSPVYENGMRHWSLDDLTNDVKNNTLPQVSWVLPSQDDSEHPGAPSSPYRASDFTHKVLTAITSNPEVWAKTVFFLTFDENDGLFDHAPAPAVPSYNIDNTLAGKSTIDLAGMYFHNDKGMEKFPSPSNPKEHRIYQDPRDTISGNIRPWGLGPRVPMYIISPWSKGGWVHSEVADHTSVAQFIEKRFGVVVPAISPWHRAISSDLTAAFDFETPNDPVFPDMPDTSQYAVKEALSKKLPRAIAPEEPSPLYQEKGMRFSRALPYRLHCSMQYLKDKRQVQLLFNNEGSKGAVYHVYNMHRLYAIPRRYTVEAGKSLSDEWDATAEGMYDLEVYGPNGYFQKFRGNINADEPLVTLEYHHKKARLTIIIHNDTMNTVAADIVSNAYGYASPGRLIVQAGKTGKYKYQLEASAHWYDFTVTAGNGLFHRFAGRLETGKHSTSDPAMATEI
jgi:phospholipase C